MYALIAHVVITMEDDDDDDDARVTHGGGPRVTAERANNCRRRRPSFVMFYYRSTTMSTVGTRNVHKRILNYKLCTLKSNRAECVADRYASVLSGVLENNRFYSSVSNFSLGIFSESFLNISKYVQNRDCTISI